MVALLDLYTVSTVVFKHSLLKYLIIMTYYTMGFINCWAVMESYDGKQVTVYFIFYGNKKQ